jgi:hypothetical protein
LAELPNASEYPTKNHSSEPMAMPLSVCIIIDMQFLRRIMPAWHRPMAGVCIMTNAVANTIMAVSPVSKPGKSWPGSMPREDVDEPPSTSEPMTLDPSNLCGAIRSLFLFLDKSLKLNLKQPL